ncbi:Transmembrane protein C9orf91-like protein [Aphelenchoides fujianensis]|nr:Transmembrane protein C9orf91-like protein [Aphelenchoides fujianensis]
MTEPTKIPPPLPPRVSVDAPASATLSEVFLDDNAWSTAQYSNQHSADGKEEEKPAEKKPEVSIAKQADEIEVVDDKKSLKTGKVISLVYPSNKHCAWLSPPVYQFDKMPKAFSSKELQIPHSDYRLFMRTITADIRFQSYCILFSRVVPMWILTSVVILLFMLLASQDGGLHVLLFTVLWTVMLCLGLGFCVLIRKYLVHALHLVVRDANEKSMKHNILVGVQDRGQLSCHKVVLVIIYYTFDDCIADVKKLIRVNKANQPAKTEMPAEEELEAQAREILLNHAQEYVKAYAKKQLVFPTRPSEGVSEFRPKHCSSSICICQFIEKKVFHSLPLS